MTWPSSSCTSSAAALPWSTSRRSDTRTAAAIRLLILRQHAAREAFERLEHRAAVDEDGRLLRHAGHHRVRRDRSSPRRSSRAGRTPPASGRRRRSCTGSLNCCDRERARAAEAHDRAAAAHELLEAREILGGRRDRRTRAARRARRQPPPCAATAAARRRPRPESAHPQRGSTTSTFCRERRTEVGRPQRDELEAVLLEHPARPAFVHARPQGRKRPMRGRVSGSRRRRSRARRRAPASCTSSACAASDSPLMT